MTVNLYRITDPDIKVNKTLPSTSGNFLAITADYGFEGNQDCGTPSIIIESTTEPLYNYCYIDSLHRYYYVTSRTWLSGQLWRLSLRVDVLKTYATEISGLSGTFIYSGSGESTRYDPRLVYNLPPTLSEIDGALGYDYTGNNVYIVMAVRYMEFWGPTATGFRATNEMQYIVFSPEAYFCFKSNFLALSDENRVAVSQTICSVTVVRWLDMSGITKTTVASFSSPEIYAKVHQDIQITSSFLNTTYPGPYDVWQIRADDYHAKRYLAFADTCLTYASRKAQRLIEIPYIGQVNVDLDNLGTPSYTGFYICAEISYDFGGNEYVVTLGLGASNISSAASATYKRQDFVTFPNTYTANFITDDSYNAETETRASQVLSMIGTAAAGIVSGIITEGATIPATVASLGIGAANFALSEQKLEYQKAASMKISGTSNGGSPYNALTYNVTTPTPHIVKPAAKLYKKITNSSTDPTNFAAAYGKPDGAFRTVLSLSGTGFAQMGAVTMSGFSSATEAERNEIKQYLLSGVIL